jgi:hypothetical protein
MIEYYLTSKTARLSDQLWHSHQQLGGTNVDDDGWCARSPRTFLISSTANSHFCSRLDHHSCRESTRKVRETVTWVWSAMP